MLYDLEPGLQKRFEHHIAYEVFKELKLIFQANARVVRYEVSNKFYSCKMEENSSVSDYIHIMFGYLIHLCRGLGATYAKGWLIMVGASRTSPVPGIGMRRIHARPENLPSFRGLLGDNTPTTALRGLRMITKVK